MDEFIIAIPEALLEALREAEDIPVDQAPPIIVRIGAFVHSAHVMNKCLETAGLPKNADSLEMLRILVRASTNFLDVMVTEYLEFKGEL